MKKLRWAKRDPILPLQTKLQIARRGTCFLREINEATTVLQETYHFHVTFTASTSNNSRRNQEQKMVGELSNKIMYKIYIFSVSIGS